MDFLVVLIVMSGSLLLLDLAALALGSDSRESFRPPPGEPVVRTR
jgi:hypothetical protein